MALRWSLGKRFEFPEEVHIAGEAMPETPRRLQMHRSASSVTVTGGHGVGNRQLEPVGRSLSGVPCHDLYKAKGSFWANTARSARFEQATLVVIMMNSVWIAVEVDNNPEEQLIRAPPLYQVIENLFCFFFASEWIVRFMAYKRKQDCLTDMWFVTDTFLVLMMVSETWILTIVMLLSDSISGENLSTLTVLRLLRLLRITRISRLMRAFPEMIYMIQGLFSAMRSVMITLALIMLMVYVFAIAFVQITRNDKHGVGEEYFDGVWKAMVTLTIEAVLPDQGPVLNRLNEAQWYYGVMLFIFLVLATLTMVNMLIGILCEVACRVSAKEKEILDIEMVEAKLLQIVKGSLDHNHDNKISKSEFLGIVKNEKACKALQQVGVEAADLVAHANAIFDDDETETVEEKDEEGEYRQRKLEFAEFMQLVMKLRGTNVATIRDITNLRKGVKDDLSRLERTLAGGRQQLLPLPLPQASLDTLGDLGLTKSASFQASTSRLGKRGVLGDELQAHQDMGSAVRRWYSNASSCTGTSHFSSPRHVFNAPGVEETDPRDASQVQVSFSGNRSDRLEVLGYEVKELCLRVGRLEDLMRKVIEGQQQTQELLRERIPLGASKQDSSTASGAEALSQGSAPRPSAARNDGDSPLSSPRRRSLVLCVGQCMGKCVGCAHCAYQREAAQGPEGFRRRAPSADSLSGTSNGQPPGHKHRLLL